MVVKGGDPYALALALKAIKAIKFTGRTRLVIMSDQEKAVKNVVDMIETAVINTPKGSSASARGIKRANYEVEKQIRTLRSRFEENHWSLWDWTTRCCHSWCGTVRGRSSIVR